MGSWNLSFMGGDEETSRALGDETGGPGSNSPGRKTMVSAALSTVGANDEALLSTFAEVMSEGEEYYCVLLYFTVVHQGRKKKLSGYFFGLARVSKFHVRNALYFI